MKKLFTLLMLFVAIVTGASAAVNNTTVTKEGTTQKFIDVTTTAESTGDEVTVSKQYIAYTCAELGANTIKNVWYTQQSSSSGSSATDAVSITGYRTTCNKYLAVKNGNKQTFYVTQCKSFAMLYDPRSSGRYLTITATNFDDPTDTKAITNSGTVASGTKYSVELTGLDASKYYRVEVITNNSNDSRFYQVRLEASSKTIATQEYAGVKKGGATLTAGDDFTLSEQVITLADKYAASAAPTDIQLINHRTYTDTSDDYADVDVEFSSTPSDGYFVGTTTIGLTEYTIKVPEVESYTVSYNAGAYGSGSIASGKKYKNVDFTLSSETFTREGFVQSGWATTDGGEKAYDLGGTYSENAAIELFPAWTEANTYFAPFSIVEGTPAGWTFSIPDPDTWAADNARVTFVKDFTDHSVTVPKNDGKMSDSYIAFAKSADGYALYDLGSAVTIYGMTAKLYGGASSSFNIKIDYLGADATTVQKSYTVSLGAGNWKLNTITKSDVVNDVRYIKIYGGSKWVVMSGFSVTSTADAVSTGAKITTNAGKWASFTPTYNAIVPAGTEAYIITGIDAGATLEGNTVSVMEAGKGYFIKGEASTEYTAAYTTKAADATDGNMLVGCVKDAALAVNSGADPYQYFLGTDQDTQKAGLFYVGANAVTIPAGKCYLLSNSNTPLSLTLPFEDEETAINFVEASDNVDSAAPVKVIKNGHLYIGNYNVAGARIK